MSNNAEPVPRLKLGESEGWTSLPEYKQEALKVETSPKKLWGPKESQLLRRTAIHVTICLEKDPTTSTRVSEDPCLHVSDSNH